MAQVRGDMSLGRGLTSKIATATGTNAARNQNAAAAAEMWFVDIFCNSPVMPQSTTEATASSSHGDARLCTSCVSCPTLKSKIAISETPTPNHWIVLSRSFNNGTASNIVTTG